MVGFFSLKILERKQLAMAWKRSQVPTFTVPDGHSWVLGFILRTGQLGNVPGLQR